MADFPSSGDFDSALQDNSAAAESRPQTTVPGSAATVPLPASRRTSSPAGGADSKRAALNDTAAEPAIDRISHPVFILSYVANLALVTANAATFIFADWIAWLATNGTVGVQYQEELPGRILQYGIIASISARIFLGQSIDRFGVRRVWLVMSLLALSGLSIFASLRSVSLLLPVGRILFATGLGGMFTCGTFHIQASVTEQRRTEFIALLGSSGFVGMALGAQLADFVKWLSAGDDSIFYPRLFQVTVGLLVVYIICALLATRGLRRPEHHETRPSLIRLTRRYWPGWIVGVAMAMGLIFTVPSLFLVRFNNYEQIGGISSYWTTYAATAFLFRLFTASLSRRIGRYRLIFAGLVAQGLGLWCLLPVSAWWHLLLPAVLCGFGHALLFPSIVSLGTQPFPARYRGSGTNLILGCFDLGVGISAPLLGRIIDLPQFDGVGFRPMFFVAGGIPLVIAAVWYWVKVGQTDSEIIT